MTTPGVTPSFFAEITFHLPSGSAADYYRPEPRCTSSSIDIGWSAWRLVYHSLSGTSPSVLQLKRSVLPAALDVLLNMRDYEGPFHEVVEVVDRDAL